MTDLKINIFMSSLPTVAISMLTCTAWNTHINTGLVLLYNWPRTFIPPTPVLPYPHILDLVVKNQGNLGTSHCDL